MKIKQLTAALIFTMLFALGTAGVAQQKQTAKPAPKSSTATAKKPEDKTSSTPITLTTQKDKVSYAIGMQIGKNLTREGEMKAVGEANKKEGEAFLAENKKKEGVVTLPSGLQYKIVKQGTGPKPAATDNVVCNYRGTLINGKEFDSSYKRGHAATFPVSGVIKGWTEVLQLMPVGSKYQVWVPSELAYGPRAGSPEIGPNATLVFEIELLDIKKDEKGAEASKPAEPKK